MQNFLNQTIKCSCGREHEIPIKDIIIENAAIKKVPDLLQELTVEDKVYVICDHNTFQAAGKNLIKELNQADYQVKKVDLGQGKVVPDPENMFKILEQIDDKGYIIACGSGTINDLTRYLSFKLNQPYLVVATAPSMDGYASSVSPITVNGVKKTYSAAPPEAIVADLSVLQEAPWKLIQAGFGDLIGKVTSLLDWKLSHIIFDEYYCPEAVELVAGELEKLINIVPELKNRDQKSIEILIKGLIKSGLAMLMIGKSRPASGSEHHISHFLELYGLLYDKEIPPHGIKVALGCYFSSSFYLRLRELDFANLNFCDDKKKRKTRIVKNYLDRAQPVLQNLNDRWEEEKINQKLLQEKERKINAAIDESINYLKKIENHLDGIGILKRADVKDLPQDWLLKALKSGFEIRHRYTITTLLQQTGLLEQWSEELVAKFVREVKKTELN